MTGSFPGQGKQVFSDSFDFNMIQAQNHGLVLVPMETLVLLDRAVAALKEEYRKMIHYEWLFSMPRVDSAQMSLEFNQSRMFWQIILRAT